MSVNVGKAADGVTLNPGSLTSVTQNVTVPATAYLRKKVTFTPTWTLAAGDLVFLTVKRDGGASGSATDTLAGDIVLLSGSLQVQT